MPTGKEWREAIENEAKVRLNQIEAAMEGLKAYTRGTNPSCGRARERYERMKGYRSTLASFVRVARGVNAQRLVDRLQEIEERAVLLLDKAHRRLSNAGCT